MHRKSIVSVLLVVLATVQAVGQSRPKAAELDRWIPVLLRASDVPGLSVAFVRDGSVEVVRGYSFKDVERREPVEPDTIFEAASLSKPVLAYGVLLLAREGRIDLDAPLTRYTEEPYIAGDPRLEDITARLVLSHASGFPNWRPGRWSDEPKPLTIDFEPGSRFGYSGEGYEYLRHVVERITGRSIESYLQEAVLEPLGMTNSSYVWQPEYEHMAATGHDGEMNPVEKSKPDEANVAATLHTTSADYARFLLAMLDPELSAPVDLMTTPRTRIDEALSWGLGWGVESTPEGHFFWQWGDNGPFKAFAMGSRSNREAVVVLTNGESGLKACQAIVRAAFGHDHPALDFRMLDY